MARLCPTARLLGVGVLQNWSMNFYKNCDLDGTFVYADVRESNSEFANVAVWEINSLDEIRRLDMFEGYPELYRKIENCKVIMNNGKEITGFLYKMTNNAGTGVPTTNYFKGIYQAYLELNIPTKPLDDYISSLSKK